MPSMAITPSRGDPRWLGILGEEIGEVTDEVFSLFLNSALGRVNHEHTYDSKGDLTKELYDVLTVTFAWIDKLEKE